MISAAGAVAGCRTNPPLSQFTRLDVGQPSDDGPLATSPLSRAAYRRLEAEVRPGDIILSTKQSAISAILRFALEDFSYYTHSGTIDVRNGRPVVSHASGRFKLLRNTPRLLDKVTGSIETAPLETYIRTYTDILIIRLPDPQKNLSMARATREYERRGVPMDPFFDLGDQSSLHCSEYTAKLIEEGGYEYRFALSGRSLNPHMRRLLTRVGVRATEFIRTADFAELPGVQAVARISRFPSCELSLAIADALHVLHDEISSNPTLCIGSLVAFDTEQLCHFSEPVQLYFRGVTGMVEANPTRDAAEIRRHNAILYDVIVRPHVRLDAGEQGAEPRASR